LFFEIILFSQFLLLLLVLVHFPLGVFGVVTGWELLKSEGIEGFFFEHPEIPLKGVALGWRGSIKRVGIAGQHLPGVLDRAHIVDPCFDVSIREKVKAVGTEDRPAVVGHRVLARNNRFAEGIPCSLQSLSQKD